MIRVNLTLVVALMFGAAVEAARSAPHSFVLGPNDFLLDGKPFQIRSGEIHPERIPPQYWQHRLQMVKAMGLNTVAIYVFWNAHERVEGRYDFSSPELDLGRFLRLAHEEGLWVLLRPGPYCCGEWDLGGIPSYLLRYPDIKLRTLADARYARAVENYLRELATVVRPHLVENGGPILMVQIENEYGSYPRRDHAYVEWLRDQWRTNGVNGPFYTADGAGENFLKGVTLAGAAVGLDTGENEAHWAIARRMNPGVPVFSSEVYPGWLRHWGEGRWAPTDIHSLVKFYMEGKKSFNLYVLHGGSNFGFTAGANSGGAGYEPDVTSYDYGSPVDEQGRPTPAYQALRTQLAAYLPGEPLPAIPAPIPTMAIPGIKLTRWSGLWEQLPAPREFEQPVCLEALDQNQGMALYRTRIPGGPRRKLSFANLNDYGLVLLDGSLVGTLDRRQGQHEIELPACATEATLDILVEAMGHINFTIAMESDRKGIYGNVTLAGAPVKHWQIFPFPLSDQWVSNLRQTEPAGRLPGGIFKGQFRLDKTADTFLDLSEWKKGTAWINGHNLGRYWSIGPQQRLYCPAPWLKVGRNELIILDLQQSEAAPVVGANSPYGIASPLEGMALKLEESTPFLIQVPANTVRTKDVAWPTGASVVAAHLNPMQDEGQSWGVGLALGWADERYVQVNARADGQWGIRYNGNEKLAGGCPKAAGSTVAIKLGARTVQLMALPDGADEWSLLAEFPRAEYPGAPATVRVGKIGNAWQARDWADKGTLNPCRVDWVKVY